jgi:hypothetical protein
MDRGHLIREQRYALPAVRAVQKSLPLDAPMGDSQYAVFGELDSSRFMDIKVSSLQTIAQVCDVYGFPGSRPRVQHMRSKYVSRYPPTASLRSRWISYGFQARRTRCTRECGCAAKGQSSGDGSQLRTLATLYISKSCTVQTVRVPESRHNYFRDKSFGSQ